MKSSTGRFLWKILIILVVSPCHKRNETSTNKWHKYYFPRISWIHIAWHQQGVIALKEIKRTHHFVLLMTPSFCDVLLFCIFLLLIPSLFYLSLEICFLEIWLVFYVIILYLALKLFFLFHFNEIYFLEWSRCLLNNTYIARSSLVILYPCR